MKVHRTAIMKKKNYKLHGKHHLPHTLPSTPTKLNRQLTLPQCNFKKKKEAILVVEYIFKIYYIFIITMCSRRGGWKSSELQCEKMYYRWHGTDTPHPAPHWNENMRFLDQWFPSPPPPKDAHTNILSISMLRACITWIYATIFM